MLNCAPFERFEFIRWIRYDSKQHADIHIYMDHCVIKSFSVHKFCMRKLRRAQMLVTKRYSSRRGCRPKF